MAAIIIAVRAIEERDAAIADRRAVERDRKRRQRMRDMDGTVTGQSRDMDGTVTDKSFPDKEVFPQTPFQEINPSKKMGISRAREAGPFPRPDWADPQHWSDLLANRKRKSLPNTATAHKKLIADIHRLTDADWPPGRLLEHAAAKGWAAIYNPKDDNDGRQRTNTMGGIRRDSSEGRTVAAGAAFVAAGH